MRKNPEKLLFKRQHFIIMMINAFTVFKTRPTSLINSIHWAPHKYKLPDWVSHWIKSIIFYMFRESQARDAIFSWLCCHFRAFPYSAHSKICRVFHKIWQPWLVSSYLKDKGDEETLVWGSTGTRMFDATCGIWFFSNMWFLIRLYLRKGPQKPYF